ncbi:Predicted N6-DNA-methyltransferase [Phaffia rhodozyma]|uniref:Predicted N6-DNA-methyltransferase n=1 Tax=Phaffia rhodozyma TaxID=264483 RepID=A0A0F7SNZ6_PHARH|nr:Predicted N6-DNA-methyltransferase [Phaffia rhodozyma]
MDIPTPSLDHLSKDDYEIIYDPAEDSFILLDALEQDALELQAGPSGRCCLEIGSGSGIVSSFMGTILGPSSTLYISTDINPHAAKCTFETGKHNGIPIDPILATLYTSLLPRMYRKIDILLFNPPYVPTSLDELDDTQTQPGIGSTWAGGLDGMGLTQTLLTRLEDLLSPIGVFYLVAIKQNKPLEIIQNIETTTEGRISGKVALNRKAGGENLFVLKFWKTSKDTISP